MAKITKKTVIFKATTDKPVWDPLDRDQRALLIILHDPTGCVIRARGWTLNEVLAVMDWKFDDVWAILKRPWRKDRGAIALTPTLGIQVGLAVLNEKGGSE